jgi:hypothetical protein
VRRLVQHALAGVGFSALAVGAAVAGAGGPAAGTSLAVPAPEVSVSAAPTTEPVSPAVAAERAARQAEADRDAAREQLIATAVAQAGKRSAALEDESRSISRQQAKIAADRKAAAGQKKAAEARAKAKAKADAAAARAAAKAAAAAEKAEAERAERERRARIAAQGYEPGTTDPRDIAKQILQNKFGYGADQYSCFNNIIIRESNWDVDATNPGSGAYGIPQALPGSKMASVGSDWRTNPATQIIWAVRYMDDRYGSPCQAWSFKSAKGWY